jgi:hypothetical protein
MGNARRTLAALVVGLTVTTGLVGSESQATSARDTRPCVSQRESRNVHVMLTRTQLERRWEVRGLAVSRPSITDSALMSGEFARLYALCGYDLDEAWIAVFYDVDTRRWKGKYPFVHPDATLTGAP